MIHRCPLLYMYVVFTCIVALDDAGGADQLLANKRAETLEYADPPRLPEFDRQGGGGEGAFFTGGGDGDGC